jgi:trk system potassium uptake protein TrkH
LLLFLAAAVLGLTVLLLLESAESPHTAAEGTFLDAQFEVVSALGTVGLSTGLTPALGELSRWVVILLMLVGRIGPVSVFAVLAKPEAESKARLAAGGVLIG